MHEIETKILEVNTSDIAKKLSALGSEKIQDVLLSVDWFSLSGVTKENNPWFLRVRSYNTGKVEVTWKAKSEILGVARKHKEINLIVDSHEEAKNLFEEIGLVLYAHQEKKRTSWKLNSIQFDLDTYPNMPPYLEIEAGSEKEITEMIKQLELEENDTWNDGERTLIEEKYKLNWSDMKF